MRTEKEKEARKRYQASPAGKAARAAYQKRWYAKPENRRKQLAYARKYLQTEKGRAVQYAANKKWQAKNPGRQNEINKRWQEKNRHRFKEYNLATSRRIKFGVTSEDVDKMVIDQLGACKICRQDFPPGGKFSVDHCHDSGKVRGLLCHGCNVGLGHFRDNIQTLEAAIAYLIASRAITPAPQAPCADSVAKPQPLELPL